MGWKNIYNKHVASAEEAVKKVKSKDRVVFSHACGEPQHLVAELVGQHERLSDVEIVHMISMGESRYVREDMREHFRHNSFFIGHSTRKAVNDGRADYTPIFFHQVPRLFREGHLPVDVAMIQVSPPDEDGYVSLGISVDYTKSAAENAKTVIAQVNKNMPYTHGESRLHVSDIDFIVEHDEKLLTLEWPEPGKTEEMIGENVAGLIDDGSVLQLGNGRIPDAILDCLKDKSDLGIHSEMFCDRVVSLVEKGVVTNRTKKICRDRILATFLMGTEKLYGFVDGNPLAEMRPVDYVNDPYIISQNDNVVAINSAIQVDLTGQVAAETIGSLEYSGVGGQVDFIRGAARSRGGKSVIAMQSTAKNGRVSKIVPRLDPGCAVTTTRNDVDYVATEYGVAKLSGKTLGERRRALIEIAHPDFRKDLADSL